MITWEDPPEPRRGGIPHVHIDWPAVAAELRANPGRWGWVPASSVRGAAQTAHYIASGGNKAMAGSEACARDGRVYVRYVGPAATSPAAGPVLCDPWCPGCENPIHGRAAESTKDGTS